MSVVGDNIRTLRIHRGLSQTDLAEAIGESKQTVYKYETGIITNIPLPKIEAISRVLHCTPESLVGWEVKENPAGNDGISEQDLKLLEWFRSLPPEKQRAILFSQDAPEGLA